MLTSLAFGSRFWVSHLQGRDRPSIYRICGGHVAELVNRRRVRSRKFRRILVCYEAVDNFWPAQALARIIHAGTGTPSHDGTATWFFGGVSDAVNQGLRFRRRVCSGAAGAVAQGGSLAI